jgi:hypothetical protein
MLCLKNDLFRQLYIAICHSDSDYLECRSFRIFLRHSSLSKMTKVEFARLMNSLQSFVSRMYERCRVFSLTVIISIDKHL